LTISHLSSQDDTGKPLVFRYSQYVLFQHQLGYSSAALQEMIFSIFLQFLGVYLSILFL